MEFKVEELEKWAGGEGEKMKIEKKNWENWEDEKPDAWEKGPVKNRKSGVCASGFRRRKIKLKLIKLN